MSPQSAALVESVAQALTWAINDPVGHSCWNENICRDTGTQNLKRRRSAMETKQAATVFDSSAIPPIGIDKYLMRLSSTFRCSDATFIAALIVVDRLLEYDGGRLPLTMQNVHRVFLASLVVSTKYHEDLVYSNSHYAKAGGVHLREVNRLERVLLATLDFDLRVEPEQYRQYEASLSNLFASKEPEGAAGFSAEEQVPDRTDSGGSQCTNTTSCPVTLKAQPALAGPIRIPATGVCNLKSTARAVYSPWGADPQGTILGLGMATAVIVTAGPGDPRCQGRQGRAGRPVRAGFSNGQCF